MANSRLSGPDVSHGVMCQQVAVRGAALSRPECPALADVEDDRSADERLASRMNKRRLHLSGDRGVVDAAERFDGEPEGDIRRCNDDETAQALARPRKL